MFVFGGVSNRFKDGMVAAEKCSRYHMEGISLVIRDVAEEDAGEYTVLARIKEHGLYQNLTLKLVVNGERHRLIPPSCLWMLALSHHSLNSAFVSVRVWTLVRPQIGEKAVALQDPGSVPRGSRQALHCTTHGVPTPLIKWLWYPCPSQNL